ENLQDRYEVALTHRMRRPWRVLEGAAFKSGDPLWQRWSESRTGMYGSNGAALALIGKSAPTKSEPDLFCMALLARFEGYRPRFSELIGGLGDPQGAHREPCRHRAPALGRSARCPARQLPLLRGGQRCRRRGPRSDRR